MMTDEKISLSILGFPKSISVDLFHLCLRLPTAFDFKLCQSEEEICSIKSYRAPKSDIYLVFLPHFKGEFKDVVEYLKSVNPDAEIIAFTLRMSFEQCVQGYRNGISDLISFPYDHEYLLSSLQKSIRRVNTLKNSAHYLNALNYVQFYTELSLKDDVTGLYNQRKLHLDLDLILKEYDQSKKEFSMIFIDVDHFKNVNDEFGHVIGSRLLSEIGTLIKACVRGADLVYRYGGDEFIVIFKNAQHDKNYEIANRILRKIKESVFIISDNKTHTLSVSIGFAHFPKDARNKSDILDIADRMMYTAKKSGRGKICSADEMIK